MNKYHNKTVISIEGEKFDSKYEYQEWCRLKLLEKGKIISNLKRQVPFELIPSINTRQGVLRKISYIADFVYKEGDQWYALDSKGFSTDVWNIKKRLFILSYGDVYKLIERKKGKADKIYCRDRLSQELLEEKLKLPYHYKANYKFDDFWKNAKTVFSIHNLAYQGVWFENMIDFANMRKDIVYNEWGCEHWGRINWMKGAINYSDKIVVVSPTYAKEILTHEYGEGMDYTLRGHTNKIEGILNGIDYTAFNPKTDIMEETFAGICNIIHMPSVKNSTL